jgi:hypothetical protein
MHFLRQFSFNSSGQPILSGQFAVISVRQLNFLTIFHQFGARDNGGGL